MISTYASFSSLGNKTYPRNGSIYKNGTKSPYILNWKSPHLSKESTQGGTIPIYRREELLEYKRHDTIKKDDKEYEDNKEYYNISTGRRFRRRKQRIESESEYPIEEDSPLSYLSALYRGSQEDLSRELYEEPFGSFSLQAAVRSSGCCRSRDNSILYPGVN